MSDMSNIEEYNQSVIRGVEAMEAAYEKYRSPLTNKEIKEMVVPHLVHTKEWRVAENKYIKMKRIYMTIAALIPLSLLLFFTFYSTCVALVISATFVVICQAIMVEKNKQNSNNLKGRYSGMAITDDEIKEIMGK